MLCRLRHRHRPWVAAGKGWCRGAQNRAEKVEGKLGNLERQGNESKEFGLYSKARVFI